jgi:hypothetical protein
VKLSACDDAQSRDGKLIIKTRFYLNTPPFHIHHAGKKKDCIDRESNPGLAETERMNAWQRLILPLNHQCFD